MRSFGKWSGRVILTLILLGVAIWQFGPRESVVPDFRFDVSVLGDDLDAYLAGQEARFPDITPGVRKQILWAGEPGVKTRIAVVYVHGWSATSQETRPVPDKVAAALGANLYFTRLTGHGLDGSALAQATAADWFHDMAEALAIGRRLGERVLFLSTSTGGTLLAEMMANPTNRYDVAGLVFISPNFKLKDPLSVLLTQPFARWFVPLLIGKTMTFQGKNPAHDRYWTHSFPVEALLPMAALVAHSQSLDLSRISLPALFVYSPLDSVVDAGRTARIALHWQGASESFVPEIAVAEQASAHVITGDIISPDRTGPVARRIIDWASEL